mmetsp:Transcript_6978/g.11861  ORF Transcript_6978/g.11861 Transcript_6978/m.11861 type:complete len:370 (+) Transcript_6978:35-1144(+)
MMRRSVVKLLQQVAGPVSGDAALPVIQAAMPLSQQARAMSGGHSPETPLSKVLPPLMALPRQVVNTAFSLTGKLVVAAATSGAVKSMVAKFADDVLLKEQFVKLGELDISYWAYWLSTAGYSDAAGFRKIAGAAILNLPSMEPQQVTDLVVGFHSAGVNNKDLLTAVAAHISANFTKYETEQLLKVLHVFSDFGFYERATFDDIADSITYANSYLAPMKAPVQEVVGALALYAKNSHERADLFVTLARGVSEVALGELAAPARKASVVAALSALKRFSFYPEQVDALLYYAEAEAELFSTEELALAKSVKSEAEAQSGSKLATYKAGSTEDVAHWYAHHGHTAPAQHELYVFRSALVPKSYSPAAMRAK